jgi:hypothetical protein
VHIYSLEKSSGMVATLLQKCVNILHHDMDNAINLYLVLIGARPGCRLEMYSSLEALGAQHGMPKACSIAQGVNKSRNPKTLQLAARLFYNTLVTEFMHIILAQLRALPGADKFIFHASNAEVIVASRGVLDQLPAALLTSHDEESHASYVALAKIFGYPVLSAHQYRNRKQRPWITVQFSMTSPHRTHKVISLFGVVLFTRRQLTALQQSVSLIDKALYGLQIKCDNTTWTLQHVEQELSATP